ALLGCGIRCRHRAADPVQGFGRRNPLGAVQWIGIGTFLPWTGCSRPVVAGIQDNASTLADAVDEQPNQMGDTPSRRAILLDSEGSRCHNTHQIVEADILSNGSCLLSTCKQALAFLARRVAT